MPIKLKDGRVIPALEEHAGPEISSEDAQFKKNSKGQLTTQGRTDFQNAQQLRERKVEQWNKLYGKLLENEGESGATEVEASKRRVQMAKDYEGSPDQRLMGWAVPGAVPAGTALGLGESYLLSRHLPANRASLIPFGLAALGQGWKAADLYSQIGNPDASPYSEDQKRATMNMLASAGITDIGGLAVQNALVQDERAKALERAKSIADLKPTIDAIKKNSLPPQAQPLSPEGQRMVNVAREMGAPESVLGSHDTAHNFAQAAYGSKEGLNDAQRAALSKARKSLGLPPTTSFQNVIRKLGPKAAILAGLTAGFGGLGGNEAEGAGYDPTSEMHGGEAPYSPPSSNSLGERSVNALGNAAIGGAQALPYAIPYLGLAKSAADIGEGYNPGTAAGINALPHPSQSNPEELRDRMSRMRVVEAMRQEQERQVREMQNRRRMEAMAQAESERRNMPLMTGQEFQARQPELQGIANSLATSGPDAHFYRALQEFKDHFSPQQPQQ